MRYLIADHLIELPAWVAGTQFGHALSPFAFCGTEYLRGNEQVLTERCSVENGVALPANKATGPTRGGRYPAVTAVGTEQPVLILCCEHPVRPAGTDYRELDAFDFPDAKAVCHFGRENAGHRFSMHLETGEIVTFTRAFGAAEVVSNLTPAHSASLLRFGLWMMFGLAVNSFGTVAIHSSVIRTANGAVLFLGESGTGKSTHTRLWREHIPGATLLNDDSPILRIKEGIPSVYGSPWSGKTPCYKAENCPVQGIVRLSQAPHNRIRRLPPIPALGALLPSCPPAFAYDTELQDHICDTLSALLSEVPIYHLECLPDADAAKLSFSTVFPPEP